MTAAGHSVEVRKTRTEDRPAVLGVVRAAFEKDDEAELVERIWRVPGYVPDLDLVAVEPGTGEVVGHVLHSHGDLDSQPVLGLAPLAVAPGHQRRGVGGALLQAAIARADAAGEPLIVLLGHPSYYPRFGFERARPLGIEPPIDMDDDAPWMARRLTAYDPSIRGRYRYAWD